MPPAIASLSRHFYPITKIERVKGTNGAADILMVEATATSEALDDHGTILDYQSMKEAANSYKGRIWEMHIPWAAGRAVDVVPNDELKNIAIRFKVVDPAAISKVEEGVYTGVSVGCKLKSKTGNRLFVKDWVETSLVDDASNPDSNGLNILRAAGMPERTDTMKLKDWLTRMGGMKFKPAHAEKMAQFFTACADEMGDADVAEEAGSKLTRMTDSMQAMVETPDAEPAKPDEAPAAVTEPATPAPAARASADTPPAPAVTPAVAAANPPAPTPAEDEVKRFSGVLEAALAPLAAGLKDLQGKLAHIPGNGPVTTDLKGGIKRGADTLGLTDDYMGKARAQVEAQEKGDAKAIMRMVQQHDYAPELKQFKTVKDWEESVAGK